MSKIDKNGNITITPAQNTNSHLKEGAKNGSFKESKSYSEKEAKPNVLVIFLVFLCIISIAQYLRTGNPSDITFKGFLEFLANAPNFDISWSLVDMTWYDDLGIFNWFRDFINHFTNIMEIIISFFGMIVETVEFLFYFIKGLLFP